MKRCKNKGCGVRLLLLKDADGQTVWMHSEPGDPPFLHCKHAVAAPTETVGEWATRLLDPVK